MRVSVSSALLFQRGNMKKITYIITMILGIASLFVISCAKKDSSSSSSSAADADETVSASGAISLSSKISIVDPKTTSSTARSVIATSGFAETADYNVDETTTFVFEEAGDVLDTVNSILCEMSQTRPGKMAKKANGTNYKAQVDSNKCGSGNGDAKVNSPSFDMWTVNSTKADKDKKQPMIVKAWVPNEGQTIRAKMAVKEKPSADLPYGRFKMSFKKVNADGSEFMKGYMRVKKTSGGSQTKFYMPMAMGPSGPTYDYSVKVNFNTNGSGTGATSMPNWTGQNQATGSKVFQVAFNNDYFYKQKTTNGVASDAVCIDRNKYLTSVWRYGMYDSNGARVDINSGFPITATASGETYHGYIGYYGLWMPSDAGVTDNSTVKKMDYSNPDDEGTEYKVRSWGGKLIKYTKNTITLGSIKNVPISIFTSSGQQRVAWNGTNFMLEATNVNGSWVDNASSAVTLNSTNAWNGLNFYSQALGGDGIVELTYSNGFGQAPDAPADNATVIFNTQSPVFPGDSVPANLACYRNCPDPANLASGTEVAGSIYKANKSGWFYSQNIDNVSAPTPHMYTFDNTTSGMVLKDNETTSVILSSTNNNVPWGVRTGPLFDNTTANFNLLKCSWDATKICPWNVRGKMSTFYQWETGPQSWNKLEVLVAADNSSMKFDPPMQVKYTHSGTGSNSGKSYDNASMYLEYGGIGELHGIPSFCVNRVTGAKSNCDDDSRWVTEITIPAASLVTQVADGTTEYVIKPLEVEQTMKLASPTTACEDAGLTLGSVTLPDSSDWSDPAIGRKPPVTGPPSVVSGKVTTN